MQTSWRLGAASCAVGCATGNPITSLSADGLTLAIGCPRADLKVNGVTPMMGEVHIYEYSSGAWTLSATLYDETSDGIVQDGNRSVHLGVVIYLRMGG